MSCNNFPILIAQKPIETHNQIDNILKHGTGVYNIDKTRINYQNEKDKGDNKRFIGTKPFDVNKGWNSNKIVVKEKFDQSKGRFPTNTIIDKDTSEIMDKQSGELASGSGNGNAPKGESGKNIPLRRGTLYPRNDTGGASRFFKQCNYSKDDFESFFYTSKASCTERNLGCDNLPEKVIKEEGGARTYNDRCKNCGKKFIGMPKNRCNCEVHLTAKELNIYEDTYKLKDNTPENIKKEIKKIVENSE